MKPKSLAPLTLAAVLLTGCFISSPHEAIAPEDASFPLGLALNETVILSVCERDNDDYSDWTDCGPVSFTRHADHYIVKDEQDDEDLALRFAVWHGSPTLHGSDYVFQVGDATKDDDYVFGTAQFGGNKLFLALPDSEFIPEETCETIGAEYPDREQSCLNAIDSLGDVIDVMESLDGSQQYTLMIVLPE